MAQNIESVDKQTLAIKNAATVPSGLTNQISSLSTTSYWCGKSNHTTSQCCYKDVDCLKCGKRGHLKAVCRSKRTIGGQPPVSSLHPSETSKRSKHSSRSQRTKYIEKIEDKSGNQSSSPNQDLALFNVGAEARQPIKVEVRIGDSPLIMEVHTGAAVSNISQQEYKSKFSHYKQRKSDVILKMYTSEMMNVVGEITVHVNYQDQEVELNLVVVKGAGPTLLGRNWLSDRILNWHEILHTSLISGVDLLINKYSKVFSNTLGTMSQYFAKICLKPNTTRKFWRPCPVPFALKYGIERELDKLQSAGFI